MKSPIIVTDGRDLHLFASAANAAEFMEPREVASGTYRAWDATGRALRIDLGDAAVCLELAPIIVSAGSSSDGDELALSQALRAFLDSRGRAPAANTPLHDLIALAELVTGYSG